MADNTTLNAGSGGDVIASDDVGGVKYQVVKLDVGADGAAAPVSNSNPVPVSDAGGTLTVDGTVAVTNAGITTIAGAVSGTEMQVDVLTMPTTTVAGVAAEDAAASGNPVLVGGRYDSSARTLETGDAGAIALNASGQVLVEIAAGAGSGGTAVADDADFVDGTTSLNPIGGVYESTPSSVTDGDIGMAGITSTRALRVHISSVESPQVDDAAFTPASGQVSVIGGIVTADSVDSGDAGAIAMTTARAMHVAVQGTVTVGSHAVTNAGTFATQVDGAALTALQLIDDPVFADDAAYTLGTSKGVMMMGFAGTQSVDANDAAALACTTAGALHTAVQSLPASTNTLEVVGDVAHDAGAAGNPVLVGGYATNNIEGLTQVAAADAARVLVDLNGAVVVRPYTTPEEIQSVRTTNTDGASTSLVAAGGSGVHNYLSTITIWNSSSTDGFVDLRDGTAGSVLYTLPAPQTGGCTVSFPVPLKFGDNTAIAFDPSGAISTLYISAVFFQAQG